MQDCNGDLNIIEEDTPKEEIEAAEKLDRTFTVGEIVKVKGGKFRITRLAKNRMFLKAIK